MRWVSEHSRVPVLKHDKGLVHVYVDARRRPRDGHGRSSSTPRRTAAERVTRSRRCWSTGDIAPGLLPGLAARLREAGVALRGCPRTVALVPGTTPATDADWDDGVSRPDPRRPRGGRPRRGDPAHRAARHGPGGGDRDERSRPRPPLHARGRRRRRPRERVDTAGGRQPVRHGRRDGHLDLAGSRPRAGRGAGIDDDQVRRAGRRAGAGPGALPDWPLRRVLQSDPLRAPAARRRGRWTCSGSTACSS